MALINCPVCGRQVSDRAKICVGCGSALDINYIYCEKCGKAIPEGTSECIFCGAPVGITLIDCPECGAQMPEDAQACSNCGCPLDIEFITCPECGAQMPADTVMCDNCGCPLDEEEASVQTVPTEPEGYTEDTAEETEEPDSVPKEVEINESALKADAIKQKRVFGICSTVALVLSELALFAAIFLPIIFIVDIFEFSNSWAHMTFYNDFVDYTQVTAYISDIERYMKDFCEHLNMYTFEIMFSLCIAMACRYAFVFLHKFFDKKVRQIQEEIRLYSDEE